MSYIPVSVYRSGGDSSNGGVTSRYNNEFVVPVENGFLSDEDVAEGGYFILDAMKPAFSGCPVRMKERGEIGMSMFGGNFVYTSDARFSRAYGDSPVAVHDRFEG